VTGVAGWNLFSGTCVVIHGKWCLEVTGRWTPREIPVTRRVTAVAPCGLVQVIHLQWAKSARGGQGARDRNAVPLAFEVPADHLVGARGQLQVEESHWGERNGFAEPFQNRHNRVPIATGFNYGCVTVFGHADGLLVRFQWDSGHGGAPDRWSASRDMVVSDGQWVQVCYNGRFTDIDSGNWRYEQVTVNVAWFDAEASGQVFVAGDPVRAFRSLADLW
jgi:hypothetical protein